MSFFRHLTRGLRVLVSRRAVDDELNEELRHFYDQAAADWQAKGLSADDAQRAARLEVGNAASIRDQVREGGWEHHVETCAADLRYGARQLRRHPTFALVAIVTLALGIGASTAIFSAVNPILFEALPYPHAERVVAVWDFTLEGGRLDVTFGTYREVLARARSFETVSVFRLWQPTIVDVAAAERLDGQRVSVNYFSTLGVLPAIGRTFEPSEDRPNGARVTIISDGLWRRKFAADPAIVGRQITLDDVSYMVVGVMPRSFENVVLPAADIWSPLQYDTSLPPEGREWGHHLRMIGRLHPGVPLERAREELNTIAKTPLPEFPRVAWASLNSGLIVTSLQDDLTSAVKPALLAVLAAVLLVLIIACVNVTNLMMARGIHRRAEFAMRGALGAGRMRLIRQVVTEGLLVATIGGILGIFFATFAVRLLIALSPAGLPRAGAIGIDATTLLFALGVTTLIGLIVGAIPLRDASNHLQENLRSGARQSVGGHHVASRALVVVEVALALVLLVSTGLLVRTLQNLFAISPGFNTTQLLTMQVQVAGRRFDKDTTHRFFNAALDAVRQVPGVSSAAMTSQLPLSGDRNEYGVRFEASSGGEFDAGNPAFRYAVSAGYFDAIGLPILKGRALNEHDTASAPRVAVISESLAKKVARGEPLGQRMQIGPTDQPAYTVVGVVGDVKQTSLTDSTSDAVYITPEQWIFTDNALWLVVRTRGDATALAPSIRAAIQSVDRHQPIVRIATMDDLLTASAGERQFALILFQVFGVVALLLAGTGLYGVIANSVNERIREIGVRLALGSTRAGILDLIVRQGMAVTGSGIAIGLLAAAVASRGMVSLLFGVSQLDPVTYGSVVSLLIAVSLIACGIPAWRAARVDPSITLRSE